MSLGIMLVMGLAIIAVSALRAVSSAKGSVASARVIIDQDLRNKSLFDSNSGRAQVVSNLRIVDQDVSTASIALKSSFGLKVLGIFPIVGAQRNGLLQVVSDFSATAGLATSLLGQVKSLTSQSTGTTISLSALSSFQDSVIKTRKELLRLNRPVGGLWGSIGTARRDLDSQLEIISRDLSRGNQALSFLRPFLGSSGPRTYLIAGENDAEMRDQGAVLSLALLHTQGGTFHADSIGSVDGYLPASPVNVPLPNATKLVFGGYNPTQVWQSVNASANFPLSGRLMQAMYAEDTGTKLNGVIALDVPALVSLLSLSGPVEVPSISGLITATNVGETLLHEQYEQYPNLSEQGERHDNISGVAQAVVDKMKSEHIDLGALVSALASDIAGRHLLMWDATPAYQSIIASLGASGSIDAVQAGRTFHAALENSTATKLDYYIVTSTSVHVRITRSDEALINTTVTVANATPAGLGPTFQTGPDDVNSFIPGQYVGELYFWAPRGSEDPRSILESGLQLSESRVSVLPQQRQSVTFLTTIHHAVVNGRLHLRYVPQPRLYPSELTVTISAPGWHLVGAKTTKLLLAGTTELKWAFFSK